MNQQINNMKSAKYYYTTMLYSSDLPSELQKLLEASIRNGGLAARSLVLRQPATGCSSSGFP